MHCSRTPKVGVAEHCWPLIGTLMASRRKMGSSRLEYMSFIVPLQMQLRLHGIARIRYHGQIELLTLMRLLLTMQLGDTMSNQLGAVRLSSYLRWAPLLKAPCSPGLFSSVPISLCYVGKFRRSHVIWRRTTYDTRVSGQKLIPLPLCPAKKFESCAFHRIDRKISRPQSSTNKKTYLQRVNTQKVEADSTSTQNFKI